MSFTKKELTIAYHILHVDDDPDILKLIKYQLEKLDSNLFIKSVLTLQEALNVIQTNNYDVIITDFLMPDMTGLELLAQVREKHIEIPFIMLTGHSREKIVIKALNAGFEYYIEKTGDLKALSSELHHFISKIRLQKQNQDHLFHSEEKYRILFDTAPIGIGIADLFMVNQTIFKLNMKSASMKLEYQLLMMVTRFHPKLCSRFLIMDFQPERVQDWVW